MSEPNAESVLPVFRMPRCHRHFFTGHKWWCRKCDAVTEDEFREVCEAWWRSQIAAPNDGSGAS